jgi:type II secretory pathway component PulC
LFFLSFSRKDNESHGYRFSPAFSLDAFDHTSLQSGVRDI